MKAGATMGGRVAVLRTSGVRFPISQRNFCTLRRTTFFAHSCQVPAHPRSVHKGAGSQKAISYQVSQHQQFALISFIMIRITQPVRRGARYEDLNGHNSRRPQNGRHRRWHGETYRPEANQ